MIVELTVESIFLDWGFLVWVGLSGFNEQESWAFKEADGLFLDFFSVPENLVKNVWWRLFGGFWKIKEGRGRIWKMEGWGTSNRPWRRLCAGLVWDF